MRMYTWGEKNYDNGIRLAQLRRHSHLHLNMYRIIPYLGEQTSFILSLFYII